MSAANVIVCSRTMFGSILRSSIACRQNIVFSRSSNFNNILQLRSVSKLENRVNNIKESYEDVKTDKFLKINTKRNDDLELGNNNNDPDVFGTLSEEFELEKKLEEAPAEEDDVQETVIYNEGGRKRQLTTNQYGQIIKYFINKKKLGNALDVLKTRMLKEDKVQPDPYIYKLLISGCARAGYTKKAFNLFNEMKKRGLQPTGPIYTSLLNACSSSPWASDGLKRVKRLRELMSEKGYYPNQTNYHAMIKAYGRCGELESAFNVVDEMIEHGVPLSNETFNFLLQSCVTDKEAGFRHALLVWNKMLNKGIKPDVFSFNLIIRCARDCSFGTLEATADVIKNITGSTRGIPLQLESGVVNSEPINNGNETANCSKSISVNVPKDISIENTLVENRPNLISKTPHMGDIVGLSDISLPEHRILLLGGCEGVLREMRAYNIKPNIKTFTQLLESIPSTIAAEKSLLKSMYDYRVNIDIDFFNILIKKRSMRSDYQNARAVLKMIQQHMLSPDIVTFGVLSLSCLTLEDVKLLKHDMDELGYRMNIQILGALLRNATVSWNCEYIVEVLKMMLDDEITPSPQFMSYLNNFYFSVQKYKEIAETTNIKKLSEEDKKFVDKVKDEQFMYSFNRYVRFHKFWKRKAIPEEQVHPYTQFQKVHDEPDDVAMMNTGRT